jgi:hypothetical protein
MNHHHHKDPWSDLSPWMLRVLADTTPEKAAVTLEETCRLRGVGYDDSPTGRFTATTFSAWLRGGSKVVNIDDPKVAASLHSIGVTPRFHALVTDDPADEVYMVKGAGWATLNALDRALGQAEEAGHTEQVLEIGRHLQVLLDAADRCKEQGLFVYETVVAVIPGPQGPVLGLWVPDDGSAVVRNEGERGLDWVIPEHQIGPWEILRWHTFGQDCQAQERSEQGPGDLTAFSVVIKVAINAVAAIMEAREVVRVKQARRPAKGTRGARKRRKAVRPQVYTLDPHALSSWTMRVDRETATDVPRRSPASTDGTRTVCLHTCREHQRRTWVVSPEPGEVVVDTRLGKVRKDGSRATLHCVLRTIQEHARGSDVSPRSVVLRCEA